MNSIKNNNYIINEPGVYNAIILTFSDTYTFPNQITKILNVDKLYNIFIDDRAKLRYTVFVSKRLRKNKKRKCLQKKTKAPKGATLLGR